MAQFTIKLVPVDAPKTVDAAERLSIRITTEFGAEGYELVSIEQMTSGKLLLGFKRQES
jgi:hypothetical protein